METGREAMPMTTSIIDGYAAMAVKQQLEPFSFEAPKLSDHDVCVAVTHCGVGCGSRAWLATATRIIVTAKISVFCSIDVNAPLLCSLCSRADLRSEATVL